MVSWVWRRENLVGRLGWCFDSADERGMVGGWCCRIGSWVLFLTFGVGDCVGDGDGEM